MNDGFFSTDFFSEIDTDGMIEFVSFAVLYMSESLAPLSVCDSTSYLVPKKDYIIFNLIFIINQNSLTQMPVVKFITNLGILNSGRELDS